jgi:hypothetical protein
MAPKRTGSFLVGPVNVGKETRRVFVAMLPTPQASLLR